MNELFFTSRTNTPICSVNDILLHSSYDPRKEAERFVQNTTADFMPRHIVVTGPSISYCAPFFREKFPSAHLTAVQFSSAFTQYDPQWDTVFFGSETSLAEKLYNLIGEEHWALSIFLSWKPAENAYPQEFLKTWQAIRDASQKCRNVLTTRAYFNRRWITNCVQSCLKIRKAARLQKGECPVVIAASGPSLEAALPFLRQYRNRFFLATLSSAALPLLHEAIIPDLLITTDGGYWARIHLQALARQNLKTDFAAAVALEGAPETALLHEKTIIPLTYADSADEQLAAICGLPITRARRNGTVSGTAAELALSLTTGPVLFCGLDLAEYPEGYAHTQPNALEISAAVRDFRLSTLESRQTANLGQSAALEIYASWFASQESDFATRVYRLKGKTGFKNSLGLIRDIEFDEAAALIEKEEKKKPSLIGAFVPPLNERKQALTKYFIECSQQLMDETALATPNWSPQTAYWLKTVNLGSFLQFSRGNHEVLKTLRENCDSFFKRLLLIIHNHEHV